MSRFEDRLWSELVEQHGALLAQPPLLAIPARTMPNAQLRRRLSLAGVAVSLAAALVVVALLVSSGGGPAPAYAVTQNSNGSVTVTMRELVAIPEVNKKLEELGLPVRAVEVSTGCTAPSGGRLAPDSEPTPFTPFFSKEGSGVTLDPRKIPAGDTFVIAAQEPSPGEFLTKAALFEGAAPSCLPED